MAKPSFVCHVCGSDAVRENVAFRNLPGVTSDSHPWPSGSRLGQCGHCGCVVKDVGREWQESVAEIYAAYHIYHQSNGLEKLVFDDNEITEMPRSRKLLEALFALSNPERFASALDVGTGSGVMLQALSEQMPGKALWGQDLSDKCLPRLRSIRDFQGLLTRPLGDISDRFDLVTMVHVLEHVPDPISFLRQARSTLSGEGVLLINVPNAAVNPIDLPVTDHCTHFSLPALRWVARMAGLKPLLARDDVLDKELVFIGVPDGTDGVVDEPDTADMEAAFAALQKDVKWLHDVLQQGRAILNNSENGLFGASLAGAWLGGVLDDWRGCFVDEDANRIGNSLLDHDIVAPGRLLPGQTVFVPLAPRLAARIARRLTTDDIPYIVPDGI